MKFNLLSYLWDIEEVWFLIFILFASIFAVYMIVYAIKLMITGGF